MKIRKAAQKFSSDFPAAACSDLVNMREVSTPGFEAVYEHFLMIISGEEI